MKAVERLVRRLLTNDVTTGESTAYPDVRPLTLPLDPDAGYVAALEAARAMPRWRILETDPNQHAIRAEATTPVLRFTDDLWVWVTPAEAGSRVDVRSASRVGVTDFGTNARRIRDYLSRLAATATPA